MKNLDLEELEMMRTQNEKRLRELEEVYMRKQENTQVGRIMRERMGYTSSRGGSKEHSPRRETTDPDFERNGEDLHEGNDKLTRSGKKKKSVRIIEGEKENLFGKSNRQPEKSESTATFPKQAARGRQASITNSKSLGVSSALGASRSRSRKRSESPIEYNDPRVKLYEAKFEKYLANKQQKTK